MLRRWRSSSCGLGIPKVMFRCPNRHSRRSVLLRLLALTLASAEMDRRGNLAASSCHLLILPPSSCLIYRGSTTMRRRQFSVSFFFLKSKLSKMLSQPEPVLCLVGVRRRWGWGTQSTGSLSCRHRPQPDSRNPPWGVTSPMSRKVSNSSLPD